MRLSSNQLFIVALAAMGLLAGAAYLDRTYLPVLVGVLIGAVQVFVHINGGSSGAASVVTGVNLGVPLSVTGPAIPLSTPAVSEQAPVSAPAQMVSAG